MLKVGLRNPIQLINDNFFYSRQRHTNLKCLELFLVYSSNTDPAITENLQHLLESPRKIASDKMYRILATDDLREFIKIEQKMKDDKSAIYYVTDEFYSPLLHIAALNGAEKIIRYMLERVLCDSIGKENCIEETAIAYALESHNFNIVQLLLLYADEDLDKDLIECYSDHFRLITPNRKNLVLRIPKAQKRKKIVQKLRKTGV